MATTFYVAVYDTDIDTTNDVQEFSNQEDAQTALTDACAKYQDFDKDIVASVIVDGLHHWALLERDGEYPYHFRPEATFSALLTYVASIDRSELEGN